MYNRGCHINQIPTIQGTTNIYMQILVYIIQSIQGLKFVLVLSYIQKSHHDAFVIINLIGDKYNQ